MKRNQDILIKSFNAMLPVYFISQLILTLANLINGFLVGHFLGPIAMAAVGLLSPVVRIFTAISSMTAGGYRVKCGHCMGRGETDKIFTYFLASLTIIIVIGLVLSACLLCFPVPIAHMLGANEETLEYTAAYLRGMGIACIPIMLSPFIMTAIQMNNRKNRIRIGAIIQAVGNLVFGYAAIHFLHGGIFGVGAATGLAMLCSAVFMATGLRFTRRGSVKLPSFSLMIELSRIGASDGTLWILGAVVAYCFNFLAKKYGGTPALSAISMQYLFIPLDAICCTVGEAVGSLVSVAVGEENQNDIKKIIRHSLIVGIPMIFVSSLLTFVFIRPYAAFFGATDEFINYVAIFTFYGIFSYSGYMFSLVCTNIYQAMELNGYSVGVTLIDQCNTIAAMFLMTAIFGLSGLWATYVLAKILMICGIWSISWVRLKRFPRGVTELFDWVEKYKPDRAASFEADSLEEAIGISAKVEQFLRESPAVRKNALKSALCAEEIAVSVFEAAAGKTLKNPLKITVFVSVNGDEIFLKIKDNAPAFDPTAILKLHTKDDSDPAKNSGIRLVSMIAKEMNYQNIFGLNALSVRI